MKYNFLIIILLLGLTYLLKVMALSYCLASEGGRNHIECVNNPYHYTTYPDRLSMQFLLSLTKYRTIHHDSFCREASYNNIGNNALRTRQEILGYKTMSIGKLPVGINKSLKSNQQLNSFFEGTKEYDNIAHMSLNDVRRYNHYASNFKTAEEFSRVIKYVDSKRSDFHIFVLRAEDKISDSKCAFFIEDINNFYYAIISSSKIEIGYYLKGLNHILYSDKLGGEELEVFIDAQTADIFVDGRKVTSFKSIFPSFQLCGLLFDNTSVSNVDEFIVNYKDEYQDTGINNAVENGNVKDGIFGHYCAFENMCIPSQNYVKDGIYSYKFTLNKPSSTEVSQNRNKAVHSTIMLDGIHEKGGNNYSGGNGGNKPLDSFIFSADVLFPNKGEEKWDLDEYNNELIIQEHHVGWSIPFSPSISINIHKGRLLINTIWLESIPIGISVTDNPTTTRREYFGRINSDEEEKYLELKGFQDYSYLPEYKKGEWHNITLFVKLGYTYGQKPRTILYIDNKKVIDWSTPNAYNCQEYGEYLEFGIYKWDWDKQEHRDMSPIKKRVIYFDNIHYYI